MSIKRQRSIRWLAAVALAAMTLAGAASAVSPPAAGAAMNGYPASDVTFSGHGWGPGYGMGQWGAFGYAEEYHETYQWILSHFYGGTQGTSIGDPAVRVAITENDGQAVVVTSPSAFSVGGVAMTGGQYAEMVLANASTGQFTVKRGSGSNCDVTQWTTVAAVAQPVAVPASTAPTAPTSQLLTLCRADGAHLAYRGDIQAVVAGGISHTVSELTIDEYVADVVPSEMPAIWGQFGGAGPQSEQWGFQALEAQAVAARTYTEAYKADGGYGGYADVCDSYCQTYPGISNESALSTQAVADTSGVALLMQGTDNFALTEYSASTGGWTVSGIFPAVQDLGDAVCVQSPYYTCNPNHDWTASVPVADIETTFPSVGALTSVLVTERNSLGDLGGRVLTVAIEGTHGSTSLSGWQFAIDFGLDSDWFAVTNGPGGQASGIDGYWLASASGKVDGYGSAVAGAPVPPADLTAPIVSMASPAGGHGYWLAGSDGNIYPAGGACACGSLRGVHLNKPIVGIAPTHDGNGYWMVASDGGVFSFGDARFYGSMGGHFLNKPIVGMAPTPDGLGYWLVASDGGIFSFGDARFHGSAGSLRLNKPIVGMAATPDGGGYTLVASDGGIFNYGDSAFEGSLAGSGVAAPVIGIISCPDGYGYEIVTGDGGVHPFGDAPQYGDETSGGGSGSASATAGALAAG